MKHYALGRLKSGEMNKTEFAYRDHLEALLHAGEILWYRFEGVTLKLADGCRYTPDFVLMNREGWIECHEVKGYWQDDARIKIKIAAEMFPFRFVALKVKAKKDGGGWSVEEF